MEPRTIQTTITDLLQVDVTTYELQLLNTNDADHQLAGEGDDLLWSFPDGIPMITSKVLLQMSIDVRDCQRRKSNPAWVVCVNTLVAHFLLQKLMSATTKNGLEGSIQHKISAYFATSQKALSRIHTLAPPCLQNIQALVFGVNTRSVM